MVFHGFQFGHDMRQDMSVIARSALPERLRDELKLFLAVYGIDRGDRRAGEPPIPELANCDLCGMAVTMGRLLESKHTLHCEITRRPTGPPLVMVGPRPVEKPEDGLFFLCPSCFAAPESN